MTAATRRMCGLVAIGLLAALALAACGGPANPLVGKWKSLAAGEAGYTVEFKDDGTWATDAGTSGTYRVLEGNRVEVTQSDGEQSIGEFTIAGDEMTLRPAGGSYIGEEHFARVK